MVSRIFCVNFFFSIFIFFYYGNLFYFITSSLGLFLICYQWWRDLRSEYCNFGSPSGLLDLCLKYSMILFISSEVFFFVSFFWRYFHYMFSDSFDLGWLWSPLSVLMFDYSNVPFINTILLLRSGLTITISHNYYINHDYTYSLFYLVLTLILGSTFTIFQYIEYCSSFFSIYDSRFGRVYYVLTGFHGVHVVIGSVFIFVTLVRSSNIFLCEDSMTRFDLCSWYWHFVDVVWIILYFFIYFLSLLRLSIFCTVDFHSIRLKRKLNLLYTFYH